MSRHPDWIELPGFVVRTTDGAYLVDFGDKEVWVPRSQGEPDDVYDKFWIAEWLASKEGLI